MSGAFRRDGRDFYNTPDGQLVSVDAGFDVATAYQGLTPATADDVAARDYEKSRAPVDVKSEFNRNEQGDLNPDAALGTSDVPQDSDGLAKIKEFIALEPTPPEAPKAFSKDGRDYYVGGDGKLVSLDAGFDPSEEYPDLKPATAEQVHAREIQKRSGHLIDRVETYGHTAAAATTELGAFAYNFARDDVGGLLWPPSAHGYQPVKASELAPGLYGAKEKEQREANPATAFISAAVPDLAANLFLPGAGVEAAAARTAVAAAERASLLARVGRAAASAGSHAVTEVIGAGPRTAAARILASSMVTEAGDAVIEGHEFDMGKALGVWAPTQLAFELGGNTALRGVATAFGAGRNAVTNALERSRTTAVNDALREVDPAKRAEKLIRNSARIYEKAQTELDTALGVIDERLAAAPEKLFTNSALKRSVSNNLRVQADTMVELAVQAAHAAEVTGAPTLEKAAKLLDGVRGSSGPVLYKTLREVRALLTEAGESAGERSWASYALDNPLAREMVENVEKTLADENVWGKAARDHTTMLSEAARAAEPVKHSVRDLTAREALTERLEQARRVSSIGKDETLGKAAEQARGALGMADEVSGAHLLGDKASNETITTMRKMLDAFPERAAKLGETVTRGLERLAGVADNLLPDTWTAQRVETHIAERAAGSKAARAELDDALRQAEKLTAQGKKAGTLTAAKAAKADAQIAALRGALDEVDEAYKASKTVRDYDAGSRNVVEQTIDKVTGKVASKLASRAVSTAAATAAGYAGGGVPGALAGMVGGEAINHVIEPIIKEKASKFAGWLKDKLRKHGRHGAAVAALYGANELANDETDPSPQAAAAAGLFGLSLFTPQAGGKAMSIVKAMRQLDEHIIGNKIAKDEWRDAAVELFGRDGLAVYDALKVIDRYNVDLTAKNAVAKVAEVLESDVSYRYAQNHINLVAERQPEVTAKLARTADARAEKGAATRAAKAERAVAAGASARGMLGFFGERLEHGLAQGSSYYTDRAKRMLGRKSPLTITEIEYEARHFGGGSEQLQAPALTDLRLGIDEKVAALGPDATLADRVEATDEYLREVLGAALGRPGSKRNKPRVLDPSVDAKGRYYKRKDDFDKWRKNALPDNEREATHKWQTMGYRILNAETRDGNVAKHAAVAEAIDKHFMSPREAIQLGDAAREITSDLMSALNTAVERGQTIPGRVRRGIALPEDEVERLLAAKTVTAQGFMSTSIHAGTPREFAKRRAKEFGLVPVSIEIEQSTGVPLGFGEGEVTLRPGTKFEVVSAERPGKKSQFRDDDDQGVVEVYLREIEPSKVSAADVLKGIAGTIPTEAKVAGGLLALGGAEALDDEENDSGAAMASAGALALLFGGRGKARLFNEQRIILGKKLPEAARVVADRYIERKADTIEKFVRWAATAERGPLQRGEMSLRNHIVDSAIIDPEIEALGRTWPNGPRADGFVSPHEGLDKYVKAAIDAKLAEAARRLPVPSARNTRKNVGALLDAEANAVDLAETPLHKRYTDVRVKGTEARFEKSWTALQDQLQKNVEPGLGDIERDYEATNRLAEISNAIDEALGDFDSSHKLKTDWQPGPGKNAPADDRLMRAAAGDSSVDLDQLEVDMFVAARENVERKTGFASGGLHRTPKLGDFIEQRIDWAIASAAQKAREQAAKDPTPGLRGRGLAIRHGGTDFFNDGWAEDVRHAAKTQHTSPEGLRDIKQRAIQRLNSYQVDLPKGQASAIVDDLIEAAMTGDDIERAVEDIARLANEGAEGVRVAQHRRLADTFKRFTETASYYLGFDVDQAIADYAGDFDYKHINKYVRTGDAFGSTDDIDEIEEAVEVALGHTPEHQHAQMRRDDITRKAERLQLALDYAVVNGYTAPGKTWRGVLMTDNELLALQTSDVAEAKSFMSTSADETYPMQFISGKHQLNKAPGLNKVVFEVQQRSGVPVNPGESEVLLRAGSRFRVERINDPATRAMFRLTEIDADHAYAPSQLGQRIGAKALPWVAGGALLLGGVNEEIERQQAEDADRADADRILTEAQTQADTINEAREQDLDETRDRLAYLSHQGRTLIDTAARTLAGGSAANENARNVERVPGVTGSAGVARFLGSHSNLHEAFAEKKRLLESVQRNPLALVDEMADSLAELQDRAPALHSQVARKTFEIAKFLQSKVPVPVGASIVRPEGVQVNSLAVRQFALYYSAATDPASVVTDLANNRARREQVDTLRQVWPETYQDLKLSVLGLMSEKRPTVAQRIRLDLLFDFGQQFDRGLSPGLVAALDAYRKQQGAQDGATPGAGKQAPQRRSQGSVAATSATGSLNLGPAAGPGTMA